MKMKRKYLTVIVLIVSMIFFFGSIGNVIIMNKTEKLSVVNTTEFTATVKSVGIAGEGTHEYCIIYSEEYGDKLSTYDIRRITDIGDFSSLKKGETVFFRTNNIWIDKFEEMKFIPVLTIRTEKEDIVSLTRYNEYAAPSLSAATIAGIVVALIFLLTSTYCLLLLKGIHLFRKHKKHRETIEENHRTDPVF